VNGQLCAAGACAESSELDASGALPQIVPKSDCRLNSDCAAGAKCVAGECVPECRQDADCPATFVCDAGACRYPGAGRCESAADCAKAGADCVSGLCHCACLTAVDCAAGQACDGCACHVAPAPECQTSADCLAGKRCISGACACECQTDRDCGAGQSCDGCRCQQKPATTAVDDASVSSPFDIQRLAGVSEVKGSFTLEGGLSTTTGLEGLKTVGSLSIVNTSLSDTPPANENALSGLANLTLIRGDLTIDSSGLNTLRFSDSLVIGGNVVIQDNYALLSCVILDFQARLVAHGFTGSFTHTGGELECIGDCQGALCVPSATPSP